MAGSGVVTTRKRSSVVTPARHTGKTTSTLLIPAICLTNWRAQLPSPFCCIHCSSVRHSASARKHTSVSGERETVYFWRFGIHLLFGGSSSFFRKKISSSVGGFSSMFGLGCAVGALRGN